MSAKVQVTPESANDLVKALYALGQGEKQVHVTSQGAGGRRSVTGRISCEVEQGASALLVMCRVSVWLLPTPAMPPGFRPSTSGETVAQFEIGNGWVHISYQHYGAPDGWRHFQTVDG